MGAGGIDGASEEFAQCNEMLLGGARAAEVRRAAASVAWLSTNGLPRSLTLTPPDVFGRTVSGLVIPTGGRATDDFVAGIGVNVGTYNPSYDTAADGGDAHFTSANQDLVTKSREPLLTPHELVTLPKGQAFCLLEGGQLWKVRLPLPDASADPAMPAGLAQIAADMARRYRTGEAWNETGHSDPEWDKKLNAALAERPNEIALELGVVRAGMADGQFFCEGLPHWVCKRVRTKIDTSTRQLMLQVEKVNDRIASNAGVVAGLDGRANTGGDAEGDTYLNIDGIAGSAFADALYGSSNAEILRGGGGDDTLYGSLGADTLEGTTGFDTVDYGASTAAVNVNLQTS